MSTVLITIVGPSGRQDVNAPLDAPISDLLPTFVGYVAQGREADKWCVAPTGKAPFNDHQTLGQALVADGDVITLQPRDANPTLAVPAEPEREIAEDGLSPRERTQAALPEHIAFAGRLRLASGAALSRAAEADGPAQQRASAPQAVTRPVRSTPVERFQHSWRETDYVARLDAAIRAKRLRRCATIAIISPKGGVGKTTVTALLGGLFALIRRDRTIAVDANPDYGSLGRTLTPEHGVFVDDLLDILKQPDLTVTQLDSHLGRALDGLMILPAPTDPQRMANLDRSAYAQVIKRLQAMTGLLLLDCGTGLRDPTAQAAMMAADQLILVSDAEPSNASLVIEASEPLERAGPPITLVVNKLPRGGGRLDLAELERRIPRARGLITLESAPARAARVAAGEFSWTEDGGQWRTAIGELAVTLLADWPALGLVD
jgi:MinD-like ATPase involved in chromosome partitioning or flagellar assembly